MGPQEVCDFLGVSRQRLQQLAAREAFPKPVAELASGRIWESEDIRDWARTTGRHAEDDPR